MSEQIEEKTTIDIAAAAKGEADAQDEKSDVKVGDEAVLEKDCSETAAVMSKSQMKNRRKRKRRNGQRKVKRAKTEGDEAVLKKDCSETAEVLSESQMKNRLKRERKEAYRQREAKRAKALAEGRKLQSTIDAAAKKEFERMWIIKRKEAEGRFRICIDCSFESSMPENCVFKLVYELRRCYSANRSSQNPVLYSVCSLTGKTNELLTKIKGFPSWKEYAFNSSEKSLTEMYPDKSKLIYLTNYSPNELDHLDDSKTYVIGGMVRWRNRETIQKAEKLGIATARLPVKKYVNENSSKLNIKRVFEILLKYRESNNDWKTAMLITIPTRNERLRICIDCSFEYTMSEHYVSKLVYQLQRCYSANRRSQNPVLYSICSLTGKTNELLTKIMGVERWKKRAFNSSEKSLTEMYPDKSKLIYLTNDSPNELDHLDDSKTYVIGGICHEQKLETIQTAYQLGIATARLPVEKYVNKYSTKLNILRLFEILLKYRESNNDWKTAMLHVIPRRISKTTLRKMKTQIMRKKKQQVDFGFVSIVRLNPPCPNIMFPNL